MRESTAYLASAVKAYVTYQTVSGQWNELSDEIMLRFDRYCRANYPDASELSQEMVDNWCRQRETETNNTCRSRIYPVVGFIRYLRKRRLTSILEPLIPKRESCTYIPHAFTEDELKNFFSACDNMPNMAKTLEQKAQEIMVPVFFRLLYSSGIRTCEARMLLTDDVDLMRGILNIRYSKGNQQHYVVLHDSMLELMRRYDDAICKLYPGRIYFFPANNNSFRKRAWVSKNFRSAWNRYNSRRATAYQLRHHYAVENINAWVGQGFEFDAKLVYLSKSMGHSSLESTKSYYSLTPGLADIIEAQTDDDFIIPEVSDNESL